MKKRLALFAVVVLTLVLGIVLCACNADVGSINLYFAYSEYEDGSYYSEEYFEDAIYLGTAIGEEKPTSKSGYTWVRFRGEDGNDGAPGQAGANGSNGESSFVHIMYATDENGAGMTATWTENAGLDYIGFATSNSTVSPTDASAYTWALFRGEQGNPGLNGGADGENAYVHIMYATDINGAGMTATWTENAGLNYIGFATSNSNVAPTLASAYTWSLFRGEQGEQGAPGAGSSHAESVFIRYSQSADGSNFVSGWSEGYDYIGFAVGTAAPSDKSGYSWARLTGEQGEQGTPGTPGASSNIFIRYSAYADGTDFTSTWTEGQRYLGIAVGTVTAPTNKEGYTWSLFAGETSVKKSIKILAIGNSFSDDATQYLWDIYTDAGYEEVIIGNMYIGGCNIYWHWINMGFADEATTSANYSTYEYRKNTTGTIVNTSGVTLNTAIADEDWDIITLQQASHFSGVNLDQSYFPDIFSYINQYATNPNVKFYWQMTWAYSQDSTHDQYWRYDNDQMTMYNAIVSKTQEVIVPSEYFDGIIPSGTTIQNLRTSSLGDTLTRDGFHLTYDVGRYAAALTWFAALSGESVDDIDCLPALQAYATNVGNNLDNIKESVKNAIKNPFAVTQSSFGDGTSTLPAETPTLPAAEYEEMTQTDIDFLTAQGQTASNYQKLKLDWNVGKFYDSSRDASDPDYLYDSVQEFGQGGAWFSATRIFSKEMLPNGTILRINSGYQYRPDAWTSLTALTTSRPGNVTTSVVTVDATWWGSFSYRAFNLSSTTSGTQFTLADCANLSIYVPVYEEMTQADIDFLTAQGQTASNYKKLNLGWMTNAFYNSADEGASTLWTTATRDNAVNFNVTKIFSKEQLPNGTVIWVKSGYQYRPEGWTSLSTMNTYDIRPANVSTEVVTVDDVWWGSWNYRAFNLAYVGATTVTTAADSANFCIFVPV